MGKKKYTFSDLFAGCGGIKNIRNLLLNTVMPQKILWTRDELIVTLTLRKILYICSWRSGLK